MRTAIPAPARACIVRPRHRVTHQPPDRGTVSSIDVCATALIVYERVLARVPESDPDLALGQTYECGRRALLARMRTTPWRVPPRAVVAAQELFGHASQAEEDEAIDLVGSFPARVLDTLDRRGSQRPIPRNRYRRWTDLR